MRATGHIVLQALDSGPNVIVVLQSDGPSGYRIADVNATFVRLTGYTREQSLGMPLSMLHGPATSAETHRAMENAIAQAASLRGEIEYANCDGRAVWFAFDLTNIVDSATGVRNCILIGSDITERRKLDHEQSLMQAMLASVFQKVDAAVVIVRSTGAILLGNPGFQALIGFSADELPHKTVREITAPEYRDAAAAAHARQLTTGKPYGMDLVTIRKDGTHVHVHLTSVVVQRADMQLFRVVTLRQLERAPAPAKPQSNTQAVLGCIQFLGLDPVKAAYGPRWGAMRSRLLLAAENIIKRRLSVADTYSRTADDGFNIWFKQGTEEENASRTARIGREIRVMLLGELGEETVCSVGSYTQMADFADPAAPPAVNMANFTDQLAERRREAERRARDLLDLVTRERPQELTPVCNSSGQAIQAAFIDLPRALRGRFAGAMSLVGGPDADTDAELLRLGLAADAVMEDAAQGRDIVHFITLSSALFLSRKERDRFLAQWRGFAPNIAPRLFIMLSEVSEGVSNMRLVETVRMLQSMAKGVGVLLEELEPLPFNPQSCAFGMVGLSSETVAAVSDAKLRGFVARMHQAKARVLIRLAAGEPTRRWHALGIDFTTTI